MGHITYVTFVALNISKMEVFVTLNNSKMEAVVALNNSKMEVVVALNPRNEGESENSPFKYNVIITINPKHRKNPTTNIMVRKYSGQSSFSS